jgi:ABC-type glutathione transport system ATPase component
MAGIVGETGCGKSSLARALVRLLPPPEQVSSGRVDFGGQDLLTLPEAGRFLTIRSIRIPSD